MPASSLPITPTWSPPSVNYCVFKAPQLKDTPVARRPVIRSRNHNGSVMIDPGDYLIKPAESNIEHNALLVLMADPDVVKVDCQQGPIAYTDQSGGEHTTVFDIVVTLKNGSRIAVVVKRATKARKDDIGEWLQLVTDQLPSWFADSTVLVTDEHMPSWLVSNARLFHSVRFDVARTVEEEIVRYADELRVPVSIRELASPFGGTSKVFRAIVRQIFCGNLKQSAPGLISPTTVVQSTRSQEEAG
ncbi:hypothetical protein [Bosea massiliensis]|uniref:TnsA endonuclease N-terminal domain-containing protein n=1 Tax=Bosea massiliensis TaxID=151419 RepID=A0ABW0P5T6_9HYPH